MTTPTFAPNGNDDGDEDGSAGSMPVAAPSPVIVTLFTPIKIGGKEVSALTFEEPDIDAMAEAEESGEGTYRQVRLLLGRMCGATPEEFGKMKATDFTRCNQACESLLGNA